MLSDAVNAPLHRPGRTQYMFKWSRLMLQQSTLAHAKDTDYHLQLCYRSIFFHSGRIYHWRMRFTGFLFVWLLTLGVRVIIVRYYNGCTAVTFALVSLLYTVEPQQISFFGSYTVM